jgi:PROCT (NUC072) domain
MTLLRSHMCCRRTFFAPSSPLPTSGLKSLLSCMVSRPQTTSKSRRLRFGFSELLVQLSVLTSVLQAVAWAPQRGNNNSVELPSKVPKDDYLLKDLEPLGWIKTQALELPHLSPNDITTQAKIMADHPEWGSSSICITAAFTPGSVSLSAHSLTVPGFEWGRKNQDTSNNPQVRILYRRYTDSLKFNAGLQPEHVGARSVATV